MANYVKHVGCDKCGSSDANALYDDGSSYCFSCGFYKAGNVPGFLREPKKEKQLALPDDITQHYHPDAVSWVGKYELTPEDLLKSSNPIYYSAQRHQLIYAFFDDNKNLLGYQARNLNPVDKKKRYFTQGDFNACLPVFTSNHLSVSSLSGDALRTLFLVEDVLSALKLNKALGASAMPLLGSDISNTKLSRLRPFYDVLEVFLDPNMYHKSINIAKRAQSLGFKTQVHKADVDPKEVSLNELRKINISTT